MLDAMLCAYIFEVAVQKFFCIVCQDPIRYTPMLDVRRESVSSAAAGWGGVDKDKADGFVKVKCEDCILFSAFLVDNPPVDRNEFIG